MTKGIKNREQSASASNQKRDPATGRFTRAPDGVVLRRPSTASAGMGGKRPRRPARVREGHPQSHSRRRLDIDAGKTYGSISLFMLMVHLISIR
jgi:hypothetical protein